MAKRHRLMPGTLLLALCLAGPVTAGGTAPPGLDTVRAVTRVANQTPFSLTVVGHYIIDSGPGFRRWFSFNRQLVDQDYTLLPGDAFPVGYSQSLNKTAEGMLLFNIGHTAEYFCIHYSFGKTRPADTWITLTDSLKEERYLLVSMAVAHDFAARAQPLPGTAYEHSSTLTLSMDEAAVACLQQGDCSREKSLHPLAWLSGKRKKQRMEF